jgi:hypothetical protein
MECNPFILKVLRISQFLLPEQTKEEKTMRKHLGMLLTGCVITLGLCGCETFDSAAIGNSVLTLIGSDAGGAELTLDTVVAGLKEALEVGTQNTVEQVSSAGGYSESSLIRIPMPEQLEGMASALRKIGLDSSVDAFEERMNRAAELAAAEAVPVFADAITSMTFADARGILDGGDSAATDYFRGKTADELASRYAPIVADQMETVKAVSLYNDLVGRYNQIPLVPKVECNIEDYVTEKALDGLFTVLAQEEEKIRENPAARTTELLKTVFGR